LQECLRWAEYALTKSCGFTSFTVLAVESVILPPPLGEERGTGSVRRGKALRLLKARVLWRQGEMASWWRSKTVAKGIRDG
jgi:hypothetical protein